MSVHAIREPQLAGWFASARQSIDAAAAVPLVTVADGELADSLATAAALESQVEALKLELLAEADARRLAEEVAATGTDAWAANLTGSTRKAMAGGLRLANLLRERYAATREAFAAGSIDVEQARVIVNAAEQMPPRATDEQRADAESVLVDLAVDGLNARRLRQRARRMLEVISAELADEQEEDQLEGEESRAECETWFTLDDNGDGTFSGRFVIPELHGHLLRNFLERLTSPSRLGRNRDGELVHDTTLPTMGQHLNYSEHLGLGFTELLEHLPKDGFGSVGATLLVTIPLERLLGGLGGARLDSGAHISAGEARRLACSAGLVPVVLGSRSEPLDVGRKSRLHTEPQRHALGMAHESCAAEGCERPFAWCDIHHPHPWSEGGVTSVGNGIPLCGHHHRRAHDKTYDLTRLGSGEVRFRRRR